MKLSLARFNSRLLRPVLIAALAVTLLQVTASLWLTRDGIAEMVGQVVQTLDRGNAALATRLEDTAGQVDETIAHLSASAEAALVQTLEDQLTDEQRQVSERLVDSVNQTADSLAQLMALVAPEAIWDGDTPTLTRMVRDLHRNRQVIFAAYFDAEGRPLTRYLDRSDERVQALLEAGEGRRSLDRAIDAAAKDARVRLVKQPIDPKGAVIGHFVLAVSSQEALAAAQALQQRFEQLIETSRERVGESIAADSARAQTTLQQALGDVAALNRRTGESTEAAVAGAAAELTRTLSLVLVVMGVLLVVALAVVMVMRVTSKLTALTLALRELAAGEGDLTRRVEIASSDEIGDMATEVNRFVAKTRHLVVAANEAADETGRQIGVMSQSAATADAAMGRQRDQVSQVGQAMGEMVGSIQQVAERIQDNLGNVDRIRGASSEAGAISTEVKGGIESLVAEVRHASEVVNGVALHSEQIEVVLEVIKGIAEQTNLLALNAAIEAARAGDAGRGFAVVADEVRALASKTQRSTADIQQRIEALQQEAQGAVTVIDRACGHAETGIAGIARSDERMQSVSEAVNRLFDLTNDIAAMAEQQSQVSSDVNASVDAIRNEADQAADAVEQTGRACRSLDSLSQSLKSTLGQFKT